MGLLGNQRRVKAAAASMPQFIPVVRGYFTVRVPDDDLEAVLVYLYTRAAQDVFGRDFTRRLAPLLRERLKYATVDQVDARCRQIEEAVHAHDGSPDDLLPEGVTQSPHEHHVRSLIRALLGVSGQATDDAALVRDMFAATEALAKRLGEHMAGIKRQNHFLLSG